MGNQGIALLVLTAATLLIHIPAHHLGIKDLATVLILKLMQAALGTTVAKRLPLLLIQLSQAFVFPEFR